MEEEREEKGVSVSDIFRVIFSQKWLALTLAFVITVLGTLAIYYGYGKRKGVYQIEFTLDLPNDNSYSSRYQYADGSYFYYNDYISSSVLNSVKNSDSAFADIDINNIVKCGDAKMEIKFDMVGLDKENTGSTIETYLSKQFKISVSSKYFENKEVAINFLTSLANYPISRFDDIKVNYNRYLAADDFKNALTFGTQISYISSQIQYLDELYGSLSNVIVDENGNMVANYRQNLNAWSDRLNLSALTTEAEAKNYLKDWETRIEIYLNSIELEKKDLEDARRNLSEVQESLKGSVQVTDAASIISSLTEKVTSIERSISDREKYIKAYYNNYNPETGDLGPVNAQHVEATKNYAAKINAIYEELTSQNGYIAQYTALNKTVRSQAASVTYLNTNIVVLSGEKSIMMSFLVSVVAGVVIACVTAYIVGWYKGKKKASAENGYAANPEMQLAAAAADETGEQLEISEVPEDKEDKQ